MAFEEGTTDRIKTTASNRVQTELDTRSTQVADQITPYAEALRRAGNHLDGQGSTAGGRVTGQAADQIERLSDYLRRSDGQRFLRDIESFARRRPWVAGGIGAALGFMGARFLKASAETRYSSTQRPLATEMPMSDMPLYRETGETTVGAW